MRVYTNICLWVYVCACTKETESYCVLNSYFLVSHLRDVQIRLVPVSHCQSRILETVSKFSLQSSKLARVNSDISIQSGPQERTGQNEFGQDSGFNRHEMLPPGELTVATCIADISGAVGAQDFIVHIFLSYSVLNCDKSPAQESRESKVSVTDVDEYCTQVVVTSREMLNDVCCLGASRDVAGRHDDYTVAHF